MAVTPISRSFESGGGEIHFLEYGNDGMPPLLLLHGHTDCAWSWHHISTELSDKYFVVAPDLRGHGESEWFPPYSDQFLAGDLLNVMDHCGFERPSVMAHSLGAHAASFVAGCFPHRVERLVLVEGLGPPRKAGNANAQQWRQEQYKEEKAAMAGDKGSRGTDYDPDFDKLEKNRRPKAEKVTANRNRTPEELGLKPYGG